MLSSGNGMPEIQPKSLPSYLMINGRHTLKKPLSSCVKCPMSICMDCEADIGAGVPLVTLAEACGLPTNTTSSTASRVLEITSIEFDKISENYGSSCDLFTIFPSVHNDASPLNNASVYSNSAMMMLANRVYLSAGERKISATEQEFYVNIGGRSARKKVTVNYSANSQQKVLLIYYCV